MIYSRFQICEYNVYQQKRAIFRFARVPSSGCFLCSCQLDFGAEDFIGSWLSSFVAVEWAGGFAVHTVKGNRRLEKAEFNFLSPRVINCSFFFRTNIHNKPKMKLRITILIICWLAVSCEGKEDVKKDKDEKVKVSESESEHKHGSRRTFYTGGSQASKVSAARLSLDNGESIKLFKNQTYLGKRFDLRGRPELNLQIQVAPPQAHEKMNSSEAAEHL